MSGLKQELGYPGHRPAIDVIIRHLAVAVPALAALVAGINSLVGVARFTICSRIAIKAGIPGSPLSQRRRRRALRRYGAA